MQQHAQEQAEQRTGAVTGKAGQQHDIVANIAELFSELDKGIESLKTAQAQLKVYRQALLKQVARLVETKGAGRKQNTVPREGTNPRPADDKDATARAFFGI